MAMDHSSDGTASQSLVPAQSVLQLERLRASPVTVHLLPCCIQHDGPAPVQEYFNPTGSELSIDGMDMKEASFRGRKLLGSTLMVPDGYSGLVLSRFQEATERGAGSRVAGKKASSMEESPSGAAEQWKQQEVFEELTYWNHDTCPNATDLPRRCLDWLSIAEGMHAMVSMEDVAAELTADAAGKESPRKRKMI